jgi:dipeptidase D
MMTTLKNLQPKSVWTHFATLCEIPRASLHEAALIAHLTEWAEARNVAAVVDGAGNLILKKPASAGCESQPGVILQGHLDMVCQVNSGTVHDFLRDPVGVVVRDGWVIAENTTLGADNGIGVALALAALDDETLVHPALEVLLTVNEESGMDGARGLEAGTLQGTTLINLDTEEWGHFYLGCAGGVDVEVQCSCESQPVPENYALVKFAVSGLRGGHSGIDIHLGRGNAIKLLSEAVRDLSAHADVRLISFEGGTARNAIPREAIAVCALPVEAAANIDAWVGHRHQVWRARFKDVDAGVTFTCTHDDTLPEQAVLPEDQARLLTFVDIAANGVSRISDDFPGVTDTSSNLGVATLSAGQFKATFKVRSLKDSRATELADKLVVLAQLYEFIACQDGAYPGWTPNPSSNLLALCQRVYAAEFGQPASLQVIHAGLECGLLAASHPDLDMISFGPDIRGAHAPGERVEIESVARCWQLLRAVLHALAQAR